MENVKPKNGEGKRKNGEGLRPLQWLQLAIILLLLILLSVNVLGQEQLGNTLAQLADTSIPSFLAFMESASSPITYVLWGLTAIAVVALAVIRINSGSWENWFFRLEEIGLIESGSRHDVVHGLRVGAEMAALAAFTWIVLSPIPIVPGAIHLRTFAFVPGLVALLWGRGTGFMAGYFGSIFWALLAGFWIATHTPVVDGILVGGLTGWFIAVILRGNRSREELLDYIEQNRNVWFIKCMVVNLIGGLVMAFFVGASLSTTTAGAVPWWVGFFTIGVISDTVPMIVFTAFLAEPLLKMLSRFSEQPNF